MDTSRYARASLAELQAVLAGAEADRRAALANYRAIVERLRALSLNDPGAAVTYAEAVAHLHLEELTHLDLVAIARNLAQPVRHADSFWMSIVRRRRLKQLGMVPERRLGLAKDDDERFATLAGARIVNTIYTGDYAGLPTEHGDAVLKPARASGGKGAFYLFADGRIFSIAGSQYLASRADMEALIVKQLGVDSAHAVPWVLQELVTAGGEPARDIKFYAFYGEIGLIQEVSRHPVKEYAFFDGDCRPAPCGRDHEPRFVDPSRTLTDHGGLSEAKLAAARELSAAIPVPFMRIDFLNADDELVFCEFSAAPGMSHTLSPAYDRKLGEMYASAELRLVNDLLAGKRFDAYTRFLETLRRPAAAAAPAARAAAG